MCFIRNWPSLTSHQKQQLCWRIFVMTSHWIMPLRSHQTHHVTFLQSKSFGIPVWSESTHTFVLSRFLKSNHDSSPVTKFCKNWRCSFVRFSCANGEDPSSQFPHFCQLLKTSTNVCLADYKLICQHSGRYDFVFIHSIQEALIVKIWWSYSSLSKRVSPLLQWSNHSSYSVHLAIVPSSKSSSISRQTSLAALLFSSWNSTIWRTCTLFSTSQFGLLKTFGLMCCQK